jgi:DNA-binding NarL/FixJ family response regulator
MIEVFLVDDHTVVRDGLRAVLEMHPQIHVVGDAASGAAALGQVAERQPDVVIMDIWMPEMDGFEVTRQILALNPQVKVIFLSMLGTPEHVQQALQAGASGYLLKESAGREVAEAVLAVAGGQQYFSQAIARTLVNTYLGQPNQASVTGRLQRLSQREREVLGWVVRGKSSAEIGELLHLSPKTVESYRSRLMQKLEINDLPSLVRFAIQQGLLPLD